MRVSLFLVLFFCITANAAEVEIASKRYPIEVDGLETLFPYESSHDLSIKNTDITRLIYSIHSASYSAKEYFNNAADMVNKVPREKNKTLIIAPHILPKAQIKDPNSSNISYWEFPAFWGTSRGFFNDKRVRISSYEVTDRILEEVVTDGKFPNIETIVILGHSGGGQMTNRYTATGVFENKVAIPKGIEVRYIVMAPASYLYLNTERVVKGSLSKFEIPKNPHERFDDWGYGLSKTYVYHKKFNVTKEKIMKQYPAKRILYLVGSKDNDQYETSFDKKPQAMTQGQHRLQRAGIYYNYLIHLFGDDIKKNQFFSVVKDAGHSGRSLMLSKRAMRFTFFPNAKKPTKKSLP